MQPPSPSNYPCPSCGQISDFSGASIDDVAADDALYSMSGIGGHVGWIDTIGVIEVGISCPACADPVPVRAEFLAKVKIKNYQVDEISESSYAVVNNNVPLQDIFVEDENGNEDENEDDDF